MIIKNSGCNWGHEVHSLLQVQKHKTVQSLTSAPMTMINSVWGKPDDERLMIITKWHSVVRVHWVLLPTASLGLIAECRSWQKACLTVVMKSSRSWRSCKFWKLTEQGLEYNGSNCTVCIVPKSAGQSALFLWTSRMLKSTRALWMQWYNISKRLPFPKLTPVSSQPLHLFFVCVQFTNKIFNPDILYVEKVYPFNTHNLKWICRPDVAL